MEKLLRTKNGAAAGLNEMDWAQGGIFSGLEYRQLWKFIMWLAVHAYSISHKLSKFSHEGTGYVYSGETTQATFHFLLRDRSSAVDLTDNSLIR